MAETFELYLAARKDKEYWIKIYKYFESTDPGFKRGAALGAKLRETISNLETLERMG